MNVHVPLSWARTYKHREALHELGGFRESFGADNAIAMMCFIHWRKTGNLFQGYEWPTVIRGAFLMLLIKLRIG